MSYVKVFGLKVEQLLRATDRIHRNLQRFRILTHGRFESNALGAISPSSWPCFGCFVDSCGRTSNIFQDTAEPTHTHRPRAQENNLWRERHQRHVQNTQITPTATRTPPSHYLCLLNPFTTATNCTLLPSN